MSKVLLSLFAVCILLSGCDQKKSESIKNQKVIRISVSEDPQTLDPRLSRTLNNMTYIKMFYEGLMVQSKEGEVIPGVCQEYELSKNGKVYTFHLRDCLWSNGDAVTAHHFANAWKSLLAPDFRPPWRTSFFSLKGQKKPKWALSL